MERQTMRSRIFSGILCVLPLFAAGAVTIGCAHHHHDDDHVVVVDEHGYRHEGYYDADHHWHGGWYDEHHGDHDDPHDWHH
ncbi:MAG TPA: hypothetical protein VGI81_04940 [Tepidisphaeraceae bacterium]